jgi:hypothetical protein
VFCEHDVMQRHEEMDVSFLVDDPFAAMDAALEAVRIRMNEALERDDADWVFADE